MFPECSLRTIMVVPWMFTAHHHGCSLNVHCAPSWLFPECSLNVHWMFTAHHHGCSLNVHCAPSWLFPECSLRTIMEPKRPNIAAPPGGCTPPVRSVRNMKQLIANDCATLRVSFAHVSIIILITTLIIIRAPWLLKSGLGCNFLCTCRMGTPLRGCEALSIMYQRIRVTSHGLVLKMVNPGINCQFYINSKNERDCRDWPCKSTQEPCKKTVRVWIVSLGHTLGFPYATAPFTHPDG
jgi:hypothetical protein